MKAIEVGAKQWQRSKRVLAAMAEGAGVSQEVAELFCAHMLVAAGILIGVQLAIEVQTDPTVE